MVKILSIKKHDSLMPLIPEECLHHSPFQKKEEVIVEKKSTLPSLKNSLNTVIEKLIEDLRIKTALLDFMRNLKNFPALDLFEAIKEEPLSLDLLKSIFSVREEKEDFFASFMRAVLRKNNLEDKICLASVLESEELLTCIIPYTSFYVWSFPEKIN